MFAVCLGSHESNKSKVLPFKKHGTANQILVIFFSICCNVPPDNNGATLCDSLKHGDRECASHQVLFWHTVTLLNYLSFYKKMRKMINDSNTFLTKAWLHFFYPLNDISFKYCSSDTYGICCNSFYFSLVIFLFWSGSRWICSLSWEDCKWDDLVAAVYHAVSHTSYLAAI